MSPPHCAHCPCTPTDACAGGIFCDLLAAGDPVLMQQVRELCGGVRPEPPEEEVARSIPLAGDLVAAATRRLGVDRLAQWVASRLGVDCGCPERQARLNRLDATLRRYLGIRARASHP